MNTLEYSELTKEELEQIRKAEQELEELENERLAEKCLDYMPSISYHAKTYPDTRWGFVLYCLDHDRGANNDDSEYPESTDGPIPF